MPRVRKGAARHQAKRRVLKAARGHRGQAGKQYRLAKEALIRAAVYARTDRKRRKREFRGLWITRLSAACRSRGIRYSQFIDFCNKADIAINRKMLSEIAIDDPNGFDAILDVAQKAAGNS